jgi:TrpR-related protein YerC/YecD
MKRSKELDRLFQSFLQLNTLEECYAYFEDLCTIKELSDMAQRLEVATLLDQGLSYQRITEQVDVSTATIGRVSRCLNHGTGGYRATLKKMEEK